jgi:hypothetical protein
MTEQYSYSASFRPSTLFMGRTFSQISIEQFFEGRGFSLIARDEKSLIHLVLDGPHPLGAGSLGAEGFSLGGVALFSNLNLPVSGFPPSVTRHRPVLTSETSVAKLWQRLFW